MLDNQPISNQTLRAAAASAGGPGPRERKPVSAARLRAQRANARLSTGPRTRAGKYRSALNGQVRRVIPEAMERELRARGEDPREFCRLHRHLIAIFRPRHPEISAAVLMLASAWWQKARRIRQWVGAGRPQSAELDARIEALLVLVSSEMRRRHRHWITALESVVDSPIGPPPEVRRQIEERLTLFGGKPMALKRPPAPDRNVNRDPAREQEELRRRIEELVSGIMAEAAKTVGSWQEPVGRVNGK